MGAVATQRSWQLHTDWSALTLFARNKIPTVMEKYIFVPMAQMYLKKKKKKPLAAKMNI